MPRASRLLAPLALAALLAGCGGSKDEGDRQAEVARKGAAVMSFDLQRTTHVFQTLRDGGVQTVVARDAGDSRQVRLVRSHLRREAERFRRGDFGDPAKIHGEHMPGLAELEAGAEHLRIRYERVPAGGRLRYASDEPKLVAALHQWFRAQVSDSGEPARRAFSP